MRNRYLIGILFVFFFITFLTSVIAANHNREIQEYFSRHISNLYESNPELAESIANFNNFIFNTDGFDKEARIKNVINTHYKSVVLVNVVPTTPNATLGGRGTGFFVEETDSYATIMTNYHVIDTWLKNPKKFNLEIQTPTERWPYIPEIIGYDPVSDLALLKINKMEDESFPALEFIDPKEIREGDPVVVIGHGMGMAWSSTTGHVVYDGRGGRPYNLMVQVDAVINQGNSGGPVFAMDGKVVGVAQSILSPGRSVPGWDGIGLAVHAEHAKMVHSYFYTDAYAEEGYVPYSEYPFPINSFTFEQVKDIPKEDRYYVYVDLQQGQKDLEYAGIKAGLKQGDILLEINGDRVYSGFALLKAVIYSRPGDILKVKVLRNDPAKFNKEELEIEIKMDEIDYNVLMSYVNRSQGGR